MLIKVCGLKDSQNILSIDALHPDLVGLIFHEGSPRFIGKNIIPKTTTKKVGVFINSTIDSIIQQSDKYDLSYIQLHGNENISMVKELYNKGYKIIKSFSIGETIDNSIMQSFSPFCEYFLFDTKGENAGGNGLKFNWQLLDDYKLKTPFLLSGGISGEDIEEIKKIKHTAFAGIDINSRFEISAGIKNIELIKNFINEIRK